MAARHIPWITPEEYLDREALSEIKHMFYAGLVTAMARGVGRACDAGHEFGR